MREHNEAVNRLDFMPPRADHGGLRAGRGDRGHAARRHVLRLRKLHDGYDPGDRLAAMNHIQAHQARGEVVTGLLFVDPQADDLHGNLNTVEEPLNQLGREELCPGAAMLERINASLR